MSWRDAQDEAARRLSRLHIPARTSLPDPTKDLHGVTVALIEFESDETAGLLVGGHSAAFQAMVNRAMKRALEKRGASVIIQQIPYNNVVSLR